jgi:hypothetical protein
VLQIAFKADVRLKESAFDPEMALVFRSLLRTAPEMLADTIVITSVEDGRHMPTSFHFVGRAVDVRFLGDRAGGVGGRYTPPSPEAQRLDAKRWAGRLKQVLPPVYDVVVERDHIHIEHDPRD